MSEEGNTSIQALLDPTTNDAHAAALVAQCCAINLAQLDATLSRHAGLYAYVVATYELARVRESAAKWALETAKAQVHHARTSTPVSAVDRILPLEEGVQVKMDAVFTAQREVARLKALVSGLEHRRDMLVQIAARARVEMGMH